jgi:hypothetical protein
LVARIETPLSRTLMIAGKALTLDLRSGILTSDIRSVFRPHVRGLAIKSKLTFDTRTRRCAWRTIERQVQRKIWGWLLDPEIARYTARVFGYDAKVDEYNAIHANLDFVRDFAREHRGVLSLLGFVLLTQERWDVFARAAGDVFTAHTGCGLRPGTGLTIPSERVTWIQDAYSPTCWDYLCRSAPPLVNWIVGPFMRPGRFAPRDEGCDTLYALSELFEPLAKIPLPCPLAILPVIHRFDTALTSEPLLHAAIEEAHRQRRQGTLQHFANIELGSALGAIFSRPSQPLLRPGSTWAQIQCLALAWSYPDLAAHEIEWLAQSALATDAHAAAEAGRWSADKLQQGVRQLVAAGVTPRYLTAELAIWLFSGSGRADVIALAGRYCQAGWPALLLELAGRYPSLCLYVDETKAVYPLEQIDVPASARTGDIVRQRATRWCADTTAHCVPVGGGDYKVIFTSPTSLLPHLLYVHPGMYPFRVEEQVAGNWIHYASHFTRAEAVDDLAAITAAGDKGRVIDMIEGLPIEI